MESLSKRDVIHRRRASAGLLVALLLTACTNTVPVVSTLPTPVVRKLPLTMGVLYSEKFRTFDHFEQIFQGPKWHIEVGRANMQLFNELFEGVFREAVQIADFDTLEEVVPPIDGIIEPRIEEYAFITPRDTGLDQYAVTIKYRFYLFDPDGALVASWPVIGYGNSPDRALKDSASLHEATREAMRDAAATIALEARRQPEVREWLQARGISVAEGSSR